MIPILDLKGQYSELKTKIEKAVLEVLASGSYILGENTRLLEQEVANFIGVKHAIGVASGTDALHLALRALDIGVGDEVITVSFSFFATVEAISLVGATPVFMDIDPETFNIDYTQLEKKITSKTRAIIPVHLYGQPANIDPIVDFAKKYNLYVVEDCAQSIGASFNNKKTGSFGDIGCFSFFPTKNLGAFGDGGMVTTNSDFLADRIRALRNHGGKVRYYHQEIGLNSRLDEIQAAILRVKLPYLNKWNEQRREIAYRYNEMLKDIEEITIPKEFENTYCVYHQYTIRTSLRDQLHEMLHKLGITTMIYYPVPIHQQEVYKYLELPEGYLPVTESAAKQVLSLPIYPELTLEQQEQIFEGIKKCIRELSVKV